jgi:hypothetical protein
MPLGLFGIEAKHVAPSPLAVADDHFLDLEVVLDLAKATRARQHLARHVVAGPLKAVERVAPWALLRTTDDVRGEPAARRPSS